MRGAALLGACILNRRGGIMMAIDGNREARAAMCNH